MPERDLPPADHRDTEYSGKFQELWDAREGSALTKHLRMLETDKEFSVNNLTGVNYFVYRDC